MPQDPLGEDRSRFVLHVSVAVTDGPCLLLVQEAKAAAHGRWNLPGGHVDHDEPMLAAAQRELCEETGLTCPLEGLVGVYQGSRTVRFVYRAARGDGAPKAGDQILAVRWVGPEDIAKMSDDGLVSPAILRAIVKDLTAGRLYPTSLVSRPAP